MNKPPKQKECEELKNNFDILDNKPWKIKVFVQNYYTKKQAKKLFLCALAFFIYIQLFIKNKTSIFIYNHKFPSLMAT